MASKGKGGSRPLQPVGDRQVFFNDGEDIDSAYSKRDGKVYMRCRRVPREGEGPPEDSVKKSDLAEQTANAANAAQSTAVSNLQTQLYDSYASTGGLWGVLFICIMLYLTYLLFFNEKGKTISVSLFRFMVWIPNKIHTLFTRSRPSP
jgi:hypothetical protein